MKGYTHDNSKGFQNGSMSKPPFAEDRHDGDRAAPAGPKGNGSLRVGGAGAKFGVDGTEPNVASRDTDPSASGNGSFRPAADAKRGTEGVSGGGGGNFGTRGV